ncbi:hypothetical protein SISNIDRAFT_513276 [Sistotremastrum niveocremeum HHB9708]|uniref:Uncharacterized protein n=1 Tax=Sistotremastrum niveocremeum HHB9708 TaxID=1314777 RepID=A0A164ZXR4_9AGAM|nr:hypothetical protein SISNIDRAFT_513276 [Sistotremastrum niveocremeum HHB9708]
MPSISSHVHTISHNPPVVEVEFARGGVHSPINLITPCAREAKREVESACTDEPELNKQFTDPLCDAALEEAMANSLDNAGVDLLAIIKSTAKSLPDGHASAFLQHLSQPPPDSLKTSTSDLDVATQFYAFNCVAMTQSVAYFSVALSMSCPGIVNLLPRTDGNTSASKSHHRASSYPLQIIQVARTLLGFGDEKASSQAHHWSVGGPRWSAAANLRLAFAALRRRDAVSSSTTVQTRPTLGDLVALLLLFSISPLRGLAQLPHIEKASDEEERAFIGLWRHAGFYLGIPPALLRKHFTKPTASAKLFRSIIAHGSPKGFTPKSVMSAPRVLQSVAGNWPFPRDSHSNHAMMRRFVGDAVCDRLNIPQTATITRITLQWELLRQQLFPMFGQLYPDRSWSTDYANFMKQLARFVSHDEQRVRKSSSNYLQLQPPPLVMLSSNFSRLRDYLELAFLFVRLALEVIIAVFICPTLIGLLVYKVWQALLL